MMRAIRRLQAHEEGFTLIELLIVIVILGILAAIVVFAVSGITDRGTLSACKSDLKSVTVAAEAYYAQNGFYATSMPELVPTFLHAVPNATGYTISYALVPATATVPAHVNVTSNLANCT